MTKKADLARQLIKKARTLATKKKYEESIQNYLRAIKLKPSDCMELSKENKKNSYYDWRFEVVNLCQSLGRLDKLIEIYEITSDIRELEKTVILAHKKGEKDLVDAAIQKLIEKEWFGSMAEIYSKMGKYEEAIDYYEKCFDKINARILTKNEDVRSLDNTKVDILNDAIKIAESHNLEGRLDNLYQKVFPFYDKWSKVTEEEIQKHADSYPADDREWAYYWESKAKKKAIKKATYLAQKLGIKAEY